MPKSQVNCTQAAELPAGIAAVSQAMLPMSLLERAISACRTSGSGEW